MCSAGGAAESLPMRRLSALHAPAMPHPLDQRARLVELRALLLQVPGAGHQHQEPTAGEWLSGDGKITLQMELVTVPSYPIENVIRV